MPAPYRAGLSMRSARWSGCCRPGSGSIRPRSRALAAERVESAFRAEMAYYGAHAEQGRDAASLAALRSDCAALLSAGLGRPIDVATMMGAIAFEAYPDAVPALRRTGASGACGSVCVSNWDYELGDVLERIGLAGELDGIVTSAAAGARKPDPAIFELGLRSPAVRRPRRFTSATATRTSPAPVRRAST